MKCWTKVSMLPLFFLFGYQVKPPAGVVEHDEPRAAATRMVPLARTGVSEERRTPAIMCILQERWVLLNKTPGSRSNGRCFLPRTKSCVGLMRVGKLAEGTNAFSAGLGKADLGLNLCSTAHTRQ